MAERKNKIVRRYGHFVNNKGIKIETKTHYFYVARNKCFPLLIQNMWPMCCKISIAIPDDEPTVIKYTRLETNDHMLSRAELNFERVTKYMTVFFSRVQKSEKTNKFPIQILFFFSGENIHESEYIHQFQFYR